jgi:hypothetical protein
MGLLLVVCGEEIGRMVSAYMAVVVVVVVVVPWEEDEGAYVSGGGEQDWLVLLDTFP